MVGKLVFPGMTHFSVVKNLKINRTTAGQKYQDRFGEITIYLLARLSFKEHIMFSACTCAPDAR